MATERIYDLSLIYERKWGVSAMRRAAGDERRIKYWRWDVSPVPDVILSSGRPAEERIAASPAIRLISIDNLAAVIHQSYQMRLDQKPCKWGSGTRKQKATKQTCIPSPLSRVTSACFPSICSASRPAASSAAIDSATRSSCHFSRFSAPSDRCFSSTSRFSPSCHLSSHSVAGSESSETRDCTYLCAAGPGAAAGARWSLRAAGHGLPERRLEPVRGPVLLAHPERHSSATAVPDVGSDARSVPAAS